MDLVHAAAVISVPRMDRYGEALPALYDAIELEERRAQETGVPRFIGYAGYQGKLVDVHVTVLVAVASRADPLGHRRV